MLLFFVNNRTRGKFLLWGNLWGLLIRWTWDKKDTYVLIIAERIISLNTLNDFYGNTNVYVQNYKFVKKFNFLNSRKKCY